jgi:ribosome-binding factor A
MDRIHIKEMPTLKFVYDEGHKAQMEVMALLEKDRQDREASQDSAEDPEA